MKILKICILLFAISQMAYTQDFNYQDANNNKDSFEIKDNHYSVKKYDPEDFTKSEKPKNIILIIGDGMGVTQVYAGLTANKNQLYLENLKYIGFAKTQSTDDYTTDSGAGGTAIACGKKTYNGAIGVDQDKIPMQSILKIAEENDLSTGLVSTSSITHATPASFVANNESRNNYEEIAADFLKTDVDVIIGGGKKHFDQRKDGRILTNELKEKGYEIYDNLSDATASKSDKITVLTADVHNPTLDDRGDMLPTATKVALNILSQNKEGFFLMVEGSQIDWGGHNNNTSYVVSEMLDLDRAIGVALEFAASNGETLVIVTADHETGGMTIDGGDLEKGKVKAKFSTKSHTACMVPLFAIGPGAEEFCGIYENTDIFTKMFDALELEVNSIAHQE